MYALIAGTNHLNGQENASRADNGTRLQKK